MLVAETSTEGAEVAAAMAVAVALAAPVAGIVVAVGLVMDVGDIFKSSSGFSVKAAVASSSFAAPMDVILAIVVAFSGVGVEVVDGKAIIVVRYPIGRG